MNISHVILDSPVSNARKVMRYEVMQRMGLPGIVAFIGITALDTKLGFSLDSMKLSETLKDTDIPTLIMSARDDDKVPNEFLEPETSVLPKSVVKVLHFDDCAPIPREMFFEGQNWLSYHWDSGNKILISCSAGESRSVVMAIGLLYSKEGGNFVRVCHDVCSEVRGAYPHPAILASAAAHCHVILSLDEMRELYASIRSQPPFPWTERLLMDSLK